MDTPGSGNWPAVPQYDGSEISLETLSETQSTHLLPGDTVAGRYLLLRKLGDGGLGTVFYAHDTKFEPPRPVAIKILHSYLLTDPAMRQQIKQEAGTAAQFSHPNILRVIDFEVSNEQAYIVSEFAEGGSLKQLIYPESGAPGTPLPLKDVERYLEQIAAGLDAAHAKGMIHRDVKPENILLDAGHKRAMLADFSLALTVINPKKLAKAEAWGTAAYAAPEIWQEKAGRASDIYALGVVLYEMLTGRLPFEGNTTALRNAHVNGKVPSVGGLVPGLAKANVVALDGLLKRVMAKKVKDRERSATSIYREFKSILAGNTVAKQTEINLSKPVDAIFPWQRKTVKRKLSLPEYFILGIGLIVLLVILSMVFVVPQLSAPKLTLKGHAGEITGVVWSPDGTKLASSGRDKQMNIWDAKTGKALYGFGVDESVVHSVAWSPNSEYIAMGVANGKIALWTADRTKENLDMMKANVHLGAVQALSWSPDSRRLASAGQDGKINIWELTAPNTPSRSLSLTNSLPQSVGRVNSIAWSPDGVYLVAGIEDGKVLLWSANDAKFIREIHNHKKPVYAVAWSSDSRIIASGGADSFVRFSSINGTQLDGSYPGGVVLSIAWRPDSDTTVFGLQSKKRAVVQTRGSNIDSLRELSAGAASVAWSPDGKTVAVATGLEIRLYEPETKPRLRFSQ
jgi:eukaryotic-like serine/threonine-protein kinase